MRSIYIILTLMLALILLAACAPKDNTGVCPGLESLALDDSYLEARLCSQISDPGIKDACVAELAKAAKDAKLCAAIKDSQAEGYCQEQVAELSNDLGICEKIKDAYWSDNCYFHLGVNNNESKSCTSIKDVPQKEECFYEIALATSDINLCYEVAENETDRCIYKIAINSLDTDTCLKVTHIVNKASCILKIAKLTNNISICPLVGVNLIRDDCYAYFNTTEPSKEKAVAPVEA